jgi:hypothetical protein
MMKNLIITYILLYTNVLFAQNMVIESPIPYRKGDKWGYCNQAKELIIPPKFEEVSLFNQDSAVFDSKVFWYASVKLNGKYGAINEKGDFFIPAQYAFPISFRQGFCWMINYESEDKNVDKLLIINYKNQKIFSSKKNPGMIRDFNDGLLGISLISDNSNVGLLGFIDYQGNVVIPFQYEGNSPVSDFVFQYGRAALIKNGKMGIIDKNNKIIYPFIINNPLPNGHFFEKNGTAHIFLEDASVLIIDAKGKVLRKEKSKYDTLLAIPNSNYFVQSKINKGTLAPSFRIVDKTQKPISQTIFTEISEFINGKAIAQKNNYYGIIDTQGQEIVPFIYSRIYSLKDELFYIENQKGQCGFLNVKTLAVQVPCKYHTYKSYLLNNALILMVSRENDKEKYVLVNEKGEEVKTIEGYDWLENGFNNVINLDNYFLVKKNNQYSILNSNFVEILPYYEDIKGITINNEKHLLAQKNGKFGVINLKNEILVPFEYDKIETSAVDYQNPYIFAVQKNGKEFYVKMPKNAGEQVLEYWGE